MAASKHVKIKLREVNRHLVCRLCRGYYVDATTIAECLHSFCRSCIIKYLEKNSFCPICEVQIHKTKPYLNLRLDKALQDVVYKVVPGLYHDEMKRRRDFYAKRQEQIPFATPEQCGLEERIIFSPEDSISLSLEYLESDDFENETVSSQSSESGDNADILSFPQQLGLMKLKNNDGKNSRRESQDVQETSFFSKRYLQCPAVVNIGHLKKFISMKHDLTDKMQVSVIHKRVPLPDHYTLMDVAYIYTWKRSAPLRFFYQIYQKKKQNLKVPTVSSETNESKSQLVTEELKSVKKVASEKISSSDIVKPSTEVNENNSNGDKIDAVSKFGHKQTVHSNVLKNVDNNKSVTEVKSEPIHKPELKVDNVVEETKEKLVTDSDAVAVSRSIKSEKSKLDSSKATENKTKLESHKRKSAKLENNVDSAREVKENKSDIKERLLLNPISGQLESVTLPEQCKSNLNGAVVNSEKKETVESCKKEVTNKGQKKNDSKDLKNTNVNLLKSFRKEKLNTGKDEKKIEMKSDRGSSLTITAVKTKNSNSTEKEPEKFSVEIKAGNKESEYDFDGSSPPSKIIPLQEFSKYSKYSKYMAEHREKWLSKDLKDNWIYLRDFKEKVLKENESGEEEALKKNKKKAVPSLYKINSDGNKMFLKKTPNGKLVNEKTKEIKINPTVTKIKTKNEDAKAEVTTELSQLRPQSLKIENKDGEYVVKPVKEKKTVTDVISSFEPRQNKDSKTDDGSRTNDLSKKNCKEKAEDGSPKNKIANINEIKIESSGAIDLSKTDTSPKSEKTPLENLLEAVKKTNALKGDEQMMETLLSAAQKQNVEPLLKIPQYSQMLTNSMSQDSLPAGKNISQNEITQALQFLEDLRSDIKVLEAKNQLSPNAVLEQFAQRSGNFEPYQQLYQQKIDLIRRLKRHQQVMPNDSESPQRKHSKLSPTSELKKKVSPSSEQKTKTTSPVLDEIAQYKSSLDRTITQMQLMEFQNRMLAAHSYKNLPALLQYYNRPATFCPAPASPSKSNQQKTKPSSQSPSKSPQGLNSAGNSPLANSDSPFFNAQGYNHLINAGLSSEMTYHQMFQSYLNQQEQLNQIKLSQTPKKPIKFSEVSMKSISDKYYSGQGAAKKQEFHSSVPSMQKS